MTSYVDSYRVQCKSRNEKPDVNFIKFMNSVEKLVQNQFGVRLLDLPDENYRIMYDDNYSAESVAGFVISENFYYF